MEGVTPGRRPAAVLIPVYDGAEGPTVILIRRTPGGLHSGQVAFPGGRPEPGDTSLWDTALREAREEVGIEPGMVTRLGVLPVVETIVSNYAIFAHVGKLPERPPLVMQVSEVAAVLDVPLRVLMEAPREEWWELPARDGQGTQRRLVRYFPWGEDRIWGATARMIEHLVAAIRAGTIDP